jgi:RecA/RadA recombinase
MAKSKKSTDETAEKKPKNTFFSKMKVKNEYAENKDKFETKHFINTGCYVLNGLLCGDLLGGYPSNRVIMLAGEEAVGKSLFASMAFVKPAAAEGRHVFYIDTENAVEDEHMTQHGIAEGDFTIAKTSFIEDVREMSVDILTKTMEVAKNADTQSEIPKAIFIMDSQGNLTTRRSVKKTLEGEDTKDMTKQQELKRLYAETVIPMGMLDIPFIVTNHVYQNVGGYGDPKKIAGGSGGLYNSSIILLLSKSKESEGTGENRIRVGTIVSIKVVKSRYVMPDLVGKFYLNFKTGLNPWYGLHDFAVRAELLEEYSEAVHAKMGIVKPVGLGKGTKYVLKNPALDPTKWVICNDKTLHSKDGIGSILEPLNEWVKANFKLKNPVALSLDEEQEVEMDGIDEPEE